MRSPRLLLYFSALAYVAAAPLGAADDADVFRLHAYPNPFVAGYTSARIVYYLPDTAFITLRVYDGEGRLVRTLAEDAARGEGLHDEKEFWDGRDAAGQLVAAGPYILALEARVAGESRRAVFTVVVSR